MFTLLFWLAVLAAIFWAVRSDSSKRKKQELSRRNQQWIDFIAGYANVAKNDKERAVVERMIADIAAQDLGRPTGAMATATPEDRAQATELDLEHHAPLAVATGTRGALQSEAPVKAKTNQIQVDNASLLLYFGAFLFVAAAGLFVAFGGADGVVRTVITLCVSLALYIFGVRLFHTKPRLKQAGQTFAGIGIVLAPLVGAALYAYVFNESNGVLAWCLTSLYCLALYAHALYVFRTPLMSYVLIFTFISLFQSGVGISDAPLYYYGWGLAIVGIGLQLLYRWKGWLPEIREASAQSSAILLPIAVIVSVVMVPSQGATQLGVALLLAAAFYALEISRSTGAEKESDAIVSQAGLTLGIAALCYGQSQSWFTVGVGLLSVTAAQLLVLSFVKQQTTIWRNYGSVILGASLAAILTAIHYDGLLFVAVAFSTVTAVALWVRQNREDAYASAALSWLALPYIGGQLTFGPVSSLAQTALGFAALVGLMAVYARTYTKARHDVAWVAVGRATIGVGIVALLACSFFASPLIVTITAAIVALSLLVLRKADTWNDWIDAAGFTLLVPLLHTWQEANMFLISTSVALVGLVMLSIYFRREALRWASTFAWLLLPVALGHAQVGGEWGSVTYAWAYVLAMVGLMASRAVARGVIYMSGTVPMSSYARTASSSYAAGYSVAAGLAVLISMNSRESQLHTSLILGVLIIAAIIVSRVIEKRSDILALLPVLGQALLISAIRPMTELPAVRLFLVLSPILAVVAYFVFDDLRRRVTAGDRQFRDALQISVITAFTGPLSVILGVRPNWIMAAGLLIAGLLLQYHIRANAKQEDKELAGAIVVVAIWWFMAFLHIEELQAYTHIAVATFGAYAYWRHIRGERKQSNRYLWFMIATATIPLALQALAETAPIYGWWLLLEQIAIMLLGMTIQRSFVTRWGLYVSVGAVLWQLRGLGYAALGFLALFLIALAVYKLQKYNDEK